MIRCSSSCSFRFSSALQKRQRIGVAIVLNPTANITNVKSTHVFTHKHLGHCLHRHAQILSANTTQFYHDVATHSTHSPSIPSASLFSRCASRRMDPTVRTNERLHVTPFSVPRVYSMFYSGTILASCFCWYSGQYGHEGQLCWW